MLDPWRLRLLHQLHLLGTVRAVAAAMQMSPSGVSAQLATLEAETHAQLFDRVGRRIVLTPAGLTLARRAAEILDHLDAVEAELAGLQSEPAGVVRVAAFTSAMHTVVVPAILALRVTCPQITVEVVESEPQASVPALRRGEVDLALSADFADGTTPVDADLVRVALTTDRVVLVASGSRADLGGTVTDLAVLAAEAWVFEVPGSYLADVAVRLCRRSGFEPRVVGRFVGYGPLLRHVEAGLAMTLLPLLAVDARYRVRTAELADPVLRHVQLLAKPSSTARLAVRETMAAIEAAASTLHAPD